MRRGSLTGNANSGVSYFEFGIFPLVIHSAFPTGSQYSTVGNGWAHVIVARIVIVLKQDVEKNLNELAARTKTMAGLLVNFPPSTFVSSSEQ